MTNKEMLNSVMGIQIHLLENNILFRNLFSIICPLVGYGIRTISLLENEDSLHTLLRQLENKEIQLMNTKQEIIVTEKCIETLKNMTIMQNALTGFSIDEYKCLVNYLVTSYWNSNYGLFPNNHEDYYDDEKQNATQKFAIRAIYEYPFLFTLIIMELQNVGDKEGE